jgi:hypothetical protein
MRLDHFSHSLGCEGRIRVLPGRPLQVEVPKQAKLPELAIVPTHPDALVLPAFGANTAV